MRALATIPVIVLLAASCGGGDAAPDRATAVVDTVEGVERWSYPADAAGALDWSVDTLAVLGDAFAEDEYQFAEVSWQRLAADRSGNLYVLDRQGSRVLKYDADGRHLASYGRKGEGPGELSQPLGLALGPGDTVWVSDFSNRRLTGFPPEGGDPRTLAYADNEGVPSPMLAALDGGFIQAFRPLFAFGGPPGAGGDDGGEPRRLPLIRLDESAAPVDTLWTIPEPPTDMVQIEAGDRMMIMMMSREFTPAFQWQAFSDGSVVLSDTSAYLLRFLDARGNVQRLIERGPPPRAVTEADREAARQRLRDAEERGGTRISMGGGGPSDEMRERILEQRLEKMTFAPELPRIVSLRVDPRDRVWVGVAGEVPDSVTRIDVYDRDGRLLGEVRGVPMPDVFLDGDRVGTLRVDEMDVQQVVLMRLVEGAEAAG